VTRAPHACRHAAIRRASFAWGCEGGGHAAAASPRELAYAERRSSGANEPPLPARTLLLLSCPSASPAQAYAQARGGRRCDVASPLARDARPCSLVHSRPLSRPSHAPLTPLLRPPLPPPAPRDLASPALPAAPLPFTDGSPAAAHASRRRRRPSPTASPSCRSWRYPRQATAGRWAPRPRSARDGGSRCRARGRRSKAGVARR